MAIMITLANVKGGVGKTTTALALAAGLQKAGKRVLMIDADHQCNGAQVEGAPTFYDILFGGLTAKECIQTTDHGDIIAGDEQLESADSTMTASPRMYKYVKKAIAGIQKDYDYIIVDTHPETGVVMGNILMASDYLVCPIECKTYALQALAKMYKVVQEYKEDNPTLSIMGILIIKYQRRYKQTQETEEALPRYAEALGTRLFKAKIRDTVSVSKAQDNRIPLFDFAPSSTAAQDYMEFVNEVLSITEGKED